jgi:hypothetical protein
VAAAAFRRHTEACALLYETERLLAEGRSTLETVHMRVLVQVAKATAAAAAHAAATTAANLGTGIAGPSSSSSGRLSPAPMLGVRPTSGGGGRLSPAWTVSDLRGVGRVPPSGLPTTTTTMSMTGAHASALTDITDALLPPDALTTAPRSQSNSPGDGGSDGRRPRRHSSSHAYRTSPVRLLGSLAIASPPASDPASTGASPSAPIPMDRGMASPPPLSRSPSSNNNHNMAAGASPPATGATGRRASLVGQRATLMAVAAATALRLPTLAEHADADAAFPPADPTSPTAIAAATALGASPPRTTPAALLPTTTRRMTGTTGTPPGLQPAVASPNAPGSPTATTTTILHRASTSTTRHGRGGLAGPSFAPSLPLYSSGSSGGGASAVLTPVHSAVLRAVKDLLERTETVLAWPATARGATHADGGASRDTERIGDQAAAATLDAALQAPPHPFPPRAPPPLGSAIVTPRSSVGAGMSHAVSTGNLAAMASATRAATTPPQAVPPGSLSPTAVRRIVGSGSDDDASVPRLDRLARSTSSLTASAMSATAAAATPTHAGSSGTGGSGGSHRSSPSASGTGTPLPGAAPTPDTEWTLLWKCGRELEAQVRVRWALLRRLAGTRATADATALSDGSDGSEDDDDEEEEEEEEEDETAGAVSEHRDRMRRASTLALAAPEPQALLQTAQQPPPQPTSYLPLPSPRTQAVRENSGMLPT